MTATPDEPKQGSGESLRDRAGRATPRTPAGSGHTATIPCAVETVIAALEERFGDPYSNGVAAILLHPNPPEKFERKDWADWTIRPAEAAFDWAHDRGLISPWKLSAKWTFTELGLAVRRRALAETKAVSA